MANFASSLPLIPAGVDKPVKPLPDHLKKVLFPSRPCTCQQCESAVSPLAYLADLLIYAKDRLRNGNTPVDYRFLEGNLHQKFGTLPKSCKSVEAKVRQVRIAVEVLRKFYNSTGTPDEREALAKIYHTLLIQTGTTYTELRAIQYATKEEKEALAERLGLSAPTPLVDPLKELLLDTQTSPIPNLEDQLESLFGFASTLKDPLQDRPEPKLLTWRRARLRQLWMEQDWPEDLPANNDPIIDPDIIGPDDFRHPDPSKVAFSLWKKRREWVDNELAYLKTITRTVTYSGPNEIVPDIEQMVDAMYAGRPYPSGNAPAATASWPVVMTKKDLWLHYNNLSKGQLDKDQTKELLRKLDSALGLNADAFRKLMLTWEKDKNWHSDPRNPKVEIQEWDDVYSILCQSLKKLLFPHWRVEEEGVQIAFSPNEFWFSISEPTEGHWPPQYDANFPMIDPEILTPRDLPDPTAGEKARLLFEKRKDELTVFGARLENLRTDPASGFLAMLEETFGRPLPLDLDQTATDLNSSDTVISETAKTAIRSQLYLSEDQFLRLMAIRAKENQPLVAGKPSAAEYKELNTLLTAAYKRRIKYPVWKSEENSDGLVYWRAFKSKLPGWRAAAEARTVWQQALRLRMRAPIIDPDLISSSHLHRPWTQDDKAGTLWRDRTQAIKQKWNDLKSKRETAGPIPGFENIISESLGITIVELRKIDEERKKGIDTTRRLAQLNLSTGAHNFLVQMDQLLTGNQTVDVQEWETVYSILTQVWKDRNVAAWLEAEKKDEISLSPDHFKLPGNNTLPELPPWRANFERRLEWEEKLQSRMDQEKALKEAAWQSVSAAEEIALPALRDALIKGAPVQGDTLEEKAKQLSDRLLIEMRDSGCAKTTRVSQSIETLQNLLFSVRTGQLQDTYPTLSFSPGAMESFDNDWQWMGSYSAWRAAMFVFLYPENILLPSLRKKQTPGFRGMVTHLRNVGKVTPERARQAAKIYSDYFRDVCSLKLEATTTADVNIDTNGNKRKLLFLFARSEASNKVYWCTRDGLSKDAATQTYWDEVKPLSNVLNLIGSVEYQISNTERFIYLFAKAHDGRNNKLVFVRYDLERNYWLEEQNELELPDKATNFDNAKLLKRAEQDELALSSPPKILITLSSGSSFTGQLNLNGKDWGDTPLSTSFSVSFAAFEDASRSDPQFALKSRFSNEFTAKEITRWFNAAHRFAENKGFAAGFPTFHQDGDKFGVIKLKAEAVIVTSVPANILNPAVVSDSYTAKDLAGRFAAVNQYVKTYRPDCITGFPNFIDNGMNFGITLIKKFNSEKSVGGTAYIHPINLNSKSRWENDFNADLFAKRFTACNDMVMWDGDDETQKISNFKFPSFSEAHKDHPDEICYIHAHRTYTTEYKPQIIKAEELSMIKPVYSGSFIVSSKRDKNDNERFQYLIRNAYENDNKGAPISILGYFDEAWYFAPMHIALQLHRYGYFTEALDWFSTVYDYSAPADKRKIYYGLVREDRINNDYSRLESWLGDPLDPHLIAGKRRNVYTRYTLMSIIRCFLDYADAEFSRDTSESVPLARTLYQTALELLETEDLKQSLGGCEEIIAELKFRYGDEFVEKYPFSGYGDFSILKDLAQQINVVMNKDLSQSEKMRQVETTIQATYIENVSPPIELHEVIEGSEKTTRKIALSMMALPEVEQEMQVARSVAINSLEFWGPEEMENHALGSIVPALIFTTCVPPNPLLQALRLRAANNLRKIRTCRNIAGVKRELEPYAAPTDTSTGMPVIGFGGQLIIPGVANYRPSPYRYAVLIERAKQLVQIAQQVESALLSALQQRDIEAYNLLKARQDV
ncbi:MAG: hypothetical protein L6Q97_15255, partial [Thermoanaerobaculia bacterium]|nr:hypothetical protein [Thermoanaerobaculia bacterium]